MSTVHTYYFFFKYVKIKSFINLKCVLKKRNRLSNLDTIQLVGMDILKSEVNINIRDKKFNGHFLPGQCLLTQLKTFFFLKKTYSTNSDNVSQSNLSNGEIKSKI